MGFDRFLLSIQQFLHFCPFMKTFGDIYSCAQFVIVKLQCLSLTEKKKVFLKISTCPALYENCWEKMTPKKSVKLQCATSRFSQLTYIFIYIANSV